MFKIGIIGGENSHASGFANYFNNKNEKGEFNRPDFKVTAISGHYPEINQSTANQYGIAEVYENFVDMVGKVDAVMITARDGKYHYEFAKPFIEKGLPVFVDKPITTDFEQAQQLVELAKTKKCLLSGGSSLKYAYDVELLRNAVKNAGEKICGGIVICPLFIESEYSGFWFYASHLTEVNIAIFGKNIKSVFASCVNKSVSAIIEYDKYNITNIYADGCFSGYQASVITKDKNINREIDISLCLQKECEVFCEMIQTKKMSESYDDLIYPVKIMQAIKESYETGKKVLIR